MTMQESGTVNEVLVQSVLLVKTFHFSDYFYCVGKHSNSPTFIRNTFQRLF